MHLAVLLIMAVRALGVRHESPFSLCCVLPIELEPWGGEGGGGGIGTLSCLSCSMLAPVLLLGLFCQLPQPDWDFWAVCVLNDDIVRQISEGLLQYLKPFFNLRIAVTPSQGALEASSIPELLPALTRG